MKGSAIARFLRRTVCKQNMIYWHPIQRDSYGEMRYMPPIDVPCRWDEDIDLIKAYNGAYIAILNGREVTLSATIMFPLNYTLREEGYVALGKTTDYPSDVLLDPKNVPNAREIIKLQRIPFLGANGEHPEEIFKMVYV